MNGWRYWEFFLPSINQDLSKIQISVHPNVKEELVAQKAAQERKNKELVVHLNNLRLGHKYFILGLPKLTGRPQTFVCRLQREEQENECAEVRKKSESLAASINEMRRTQASLNSDVEKLTVDSTSLDNKLVTARIL